jgi:hypothetical protein
MKPTDKEIAEAYLLLKVAGIFPLLCITVDEIIDASEGTVTVEQARSAAEKMQNNWNVNNDWQAAIEYAVDEAKGWGDEQ